ncbi:MAG: protease pro-enzyme activation domain-containing protein, partial [Solirubrobacterales bacterium]
RSIPTNPSNEIHLTVALDPRNAAELSQLEAAVIAPQGPEYRNFLSEAQYEARFAPSPQSVASLSDYFAKYGARGFSETADRLGLSFAVPVRGVEDSLGVKFVDFRGADGRLHYTALGTPVLPPAIARVVAGIGGLTNSANGVFHPLARSVATGHSLRAQGIPRFVIDNATGEQWFVGSDYTQVYGVSKLFPGPVQPSNASFAGKEAVATILMSSYNQSSNLDLPPFDPSVVSQYFNDTFASSWPHPVVEGVPVNVSGVTPPLPGNYSGRNDTTFDESENSLDLEMAGSLAPGATIVNFYFAGSLIASSSANPSEGDVADYFAQCLSSALSHNYAPAQLAAVSGSFGLPDLNDSLWNVELGHAAVTGVTVVAASGDQGDAPAAASGGLEGQWPGWPASAAFDTNGTIAVGGVSLNLAGGSTGTYTSGSAPTGFDSNITRISNSSAWWDSTQGYGNFTGSEGGVSSVYPEPSWQFHSAAQSPIVNATVTQGGSLGRSEPDVSFTANTTLVYDSADANGTYFDVLEGTSVA